MDLSGKKVIVTGASGGMGAAIVKVLAQMGASVAGVDILAEPGTTTAQEANAKGPGQAIFCSVDLTSQAAVAETFDAIVGELGGLDALVHTAGIVQTAKPEDVSAEHYDMVMNVNVRGTCISNQAVFKALKQNGGGSIINFGSVSGLRPEPDGIVYSMSKGAVHSWTRSLAHAWGEHGIRANAILPIIATPMYRNYKASLTEQERLDFERETEGGIALGKAYGDAERDLAPVVAFLISEASRFVTGQLIPVDGGLITVR